MSPHVELWVMFGAGGLHVLAGLLHVLAAWLLIRKETIKQ